MSLFGLVYTHRRFENWCDGESSSKAPKFEDENEDDDEEDGPG